MNVTPTSVASRINRDCSDVQEERVPMSLHRTLAAYGVLAMIVLGCGPVSGSPATNRTVTITTAEPSPSLATERSAPAPTKVTTAPLPPDEFTGRISCGPPVRGAEEAKVDTGDEGIVLTRSRGGAWRQTVTMTDPRLEGTVYHTFEADSYAMRGAEEGAVVWVATRRIQNDEGAWETWGYGGSFTDGTAIGGDPTSEVWIGEGAYAGLVAIMESTAVEGTCDIDVRGLIFRGAPVPEAYIP